MTRPRRSTSRERAAAAEEGIENAAAAELQATEEDLVRDNLPRAVIDLTRRMDLHQASSQETKETLSSL